MSEFVPAILPASHYAGDAAWQMLAQHLPNGVALLEGPTLRCQFANPAFCRLVNCGTAEIIGAELASEPVSKGWLTPGYQALVGWMRDGVVRESEWLLTRADGTQALFSALWVPLEKSAIGSASSLPAAPGGAGFLVLTDPPVDQRATDFPSAFQFFLHHDPLTGLGNRQAFLSRLEQMLIEPCGGFGLVQLDLNDFKRVNDSLGHSVGDAILVSIAERLRGCLSEGDLLVRYGGDEFLVLLSQVDQHKVADARARLMLMSVAEPLDLGGLSVSLTASAGLAMYPTDGVEAGRLLQAVDQALASAKAASGRGSRRFATADRSDSSLASLVLEGEIAHALESGQFELFFQPQILVADGSVSGVEALIRWRHPTRGLLFPDTFIPLAERVHLTIPMGDWILEEALRYAKAWRDEGLLAGRVAVNLSNHQMRWEGLVDSLARRLTLSPDDASLIELEVTEGTLLEDLASIQDRVSQLKSLGFALSVDDFGTGFFSPRHLLLLPIEKVKIDRSFISDLHRGEDTVALARAVIQMATCLGKYVVAEGVETQLQRDFLVSCGCHALQGNRISVPLPALEFYDWLKKHQTKNETGA